MIDILHVFQLLESKILNVEQELKCLDDKGILHGMDKCMKRYLTTYLNTLYQARVFLVGTLSLVMAEQCQARLKYLWAVFRQYTGKINTTVEVQLSTHDATVFTFLQLVGKEDKQSDACAETFVKKTKKLCDSSHFSVPSDMLIIWPVSVRPRLKENGGQNEVRIVWTK